MEKSGATGFDDCQVKIADCGGVLAKDARKVPDAANRAKGLWEIRVRRRNWGPTPLIILKAVFKGQDLRDCALLAARTLFHTMGHKIILNNGNRKQL